MFDTKEIKQAFETFGKEVIQEARSNLTRKDKNVSKELYNGLNYEFEGYKNGFRFVINMPEYGMYQDCLLYTSPSPRDRQKSRMPSSA